MSGKEQARLLGLLFWVYTAFQVVVVGLILILYFFVIGVVFSTTPRHSNEPPPELILGVIFVVLLVSFGMMVLFTIPKLVAGYGLRKEKGWARIWAIIACCMAIMSFPLGTALGVWGLMFLCGDEGKRYFEGPEYGRLDSAYSMRNAPVPDSWR